MVLHVLYIGVIHNVSGALVGGASSDNHLGGHGEGVEYEVPENIKTLHHLALQYVNQVRHYELQWNLSIVDTLGTA